MTFDYNKDYELTDDVEALSIAFNTLKTAGFSSSQLSKVIKQAQEGQVVSSDQIKLARKDDVDMLFHQIYDSGYGKEAENQARQQLKSVNDVVQSVVKEKRPKT